MEERQALAVGGVGIHRQLRPGRRIEGAAALGRLERAGDDPEAGPELPATPDLVAADGREDVGLIVLKEAWRVGRQVAAHAAREGVRQPAEEALVGLIAEQPLDAVRLSGTGVPGALDDQVVEGLVELFDGQIDLRRTLLLDAEIVVDRAVRAQPLLAVDRIGLKRGGGLVVHADCSLQRRARKAARQILSCVDTRRKILAGGGVLVVRPHPWHDAGPVPGHDLPLGIDLRQQARAGVGGLDGRVGGAQVGLARAARRRAAQAQVVALVDQVEAHVGGDVGAEPLRDLDPA